MSNWVAHLAFKPAVLLVVGALLSSTICLEAQMVHRLKGSIRDGAGSGLPDVMIRAEAVTGFRGQPSREPKNRPRYRRLLANGV